jgi:hypothetical protein
VRRKTDTKTLLLIAIAASLCAILTAVAANIFSSAIKPSVPVVAVAGVSLLVLAFIGALIAVGQYSRVSKVSSQLGAPDRRADMLARVRHD